LSCKNFTFKTAVARANVSTLQSEIYFMKLYAENASKTVKLIRK
jgi:hypothetical protein